MTTLTPIIFIFMIILGIETSCDETSAAVLQVDSGSMKILSSVVSSQIKLHKKYGGVVPELAARKHVENINGVIETALKEAGIKHNKINLLAVTTGPGLITSLIVGVEAAKSLSWAWRKPLLAVNHMYGHLAANFLNKKIKFPAICLIVSGGHTELILLKDQWHFTKVGQTIDDAAGEAFDKVAKILNLDYPGGPVISARAAKGDAKRFSLPRPMINSKDLNFSFSGLKTAVLYQSRKINLKSSANINDFCASFQRAVVDVLVAKTIKAARMFGVKTIMLAGGVAANHTLRESLGHAARRSERVFLLPDFNLCTDNAAMVALAGYYQAKKRKPKLDSWRQIAVNPNWELE